MVIGGSVYSDVFQLICSAGRPSRHREPLIKKTAYLFVSLFIALALLVGCGGGGGGGIVVAPPTPPPTDWQPGVFLDESTYALRCATPGNSVNIYTASCPAVADVQGSTTDENNFLRSWSNRTYLWYDEIVDRDPGLYNDPHAYFALLKTTAQSPTGAPRDKFHFTQDSEAYCQLSQGGVSAGYGAEWAILEASPPNREIIVAYTEPNTPATANNLLRGAVVLEVDGVAVNNGNAGVLNAGLFPSALNESHDFTIRDPDGTVRIITMVSQVITNAMVQNAQVIDTQTGAVGYMTFNYHRAPAEEELIDAVNLLIANGPVDDLVLDLRYNGGGFLDIAAQLAYMIAGSEPTAGRTFETLQFNDKFPATNPVTGQPITPTPFHDKTLGFSVVEGQDLPTLSLPRVFVLTSGGTCSASEAIMNGLRGVGVDVIQIGSTTCGKPYGFYAQENCGTTYFTIQFRGVNDANYGDYTDGFEPSAVDDGEAQVLGCQVADDFSEQLGNPAENRLEVALAFQAGQGCITPVGAAPGELGKPALQLRGREPIVPRSPFDSNRIMRRP
ncbi:MAG: peptidase [Gammaproteobacteria bacterium]|nr:peptidase [Gammaproteobacteria bacterium]MBT8110685.1 peptidase [Gammaproteobacteria bacterium]NND47784.1 peptidase [Woeseiaceae bacterium]NNL45384.1 peptidase [Woeseiaceae bacterium]